MILAIVDDDEDVRRALARLLRAYGHETRTYPSAEAFEAENPSVDCLIVDVRLPGLSGIELRERMRSRATPVPVVIITGDNDPAASRPPDATSLTKPFDDVTLMAAIALACGDTPENRHAL